MLRRKNKFKLLFLIIFCMLSVTAKGDMPIVAHLGVPDYQTTEEQFRIFKECGFNVSIYRYPNLDLLVKACRYADKYGVKVIGSCPEMINAPARAANTLKKENGFMGYFMQDEPSMPDIKQRHQEIERLKAYDNQHLFYINLFPYYEDNQDWFYSIAKTKSYPEYLKAASATSCQMISFDYYPVTTEGIRYTWYYNLEMIRKESLSSGKPFWAFALSMPHIIYPQPTMAALRLQIYADLAYGAQGIQYFSYSALPPTEEYDFSNAPIDLHGKKTPTYYTIQKMNQELKAVSKLFYEAKITSVRHMKIIPQGCRKQDSMPVNLSSLKIVSSKGAIISQLEKDGHRYLAIVNKNHWDPMTVLIKAKNNTPRHLTKSLQEESMKTSYSVAPGDILLFKLL